MPNESHATICSLIDKSLAGATSPAEEQSVREHLPSCVTCAEYLEASNRAIAALDGFRFEVDPGLESMVVASLAVRAAQLEVKQSPIGRPWRVCLLAIVFTVVGSFTATQLAGLAEHFLHADPMQVRVGLTAFWVLPSLCFCMLFLLLPLSSADWRRRKGFSI